MSRLVTYRCSTCKRITSFRDYPAGFSTLGSCNITKNCTGRLVATNRTDMVPSATARAAQNDLIAWYPRRCFFNFVQTVARRVWTIVHQLNVLPQVIVYDSLGSLSNRGEIKYIDHSTITITFDAPTSGSAHLIARTTQHEQQVAISTPQLPNVNLDSNGVLTIATLAPTTQVVTGTVFIYHQVSNQLLSSIPVRFVHGQVVSTQPWSNYTLARVDGRRYNIRQCDIRAALATVDSQTYFRVTLGTQLDTLFLLSRPPRGLTDTDNINVIPYAYVESSAGVEDTLVTAGQLMINTLLVEQPVGGIVKLG